MSSLRRATVVLAIAALAGGQAGPALAADTVTVSASVSMVAPCLTVSTTSLDFGGQLMSSVAGMVTVDRSITYTSCSGTSEKIFGRGTTANNGGTATWTLTAPTVNCPDLGLNKYQLRSHPSAAGPSHNLFTFDQQLETVASGATGLADLLALTTPCTGSDGSGSTMSFQAIFTATF
jgi:hypothetical protein